MRSLKAPLMRLPRPLTKQVHARPAAFLKLKLHSDPGDARRSDGAGPEKRAARARGNGLIGIGIEDVVQIKEPGRDKTLADTELLLGAKVKQSDVSGPLFSESFSQDRSAAVVGAHHEGPAERDTGLTADDRCQ